MPYSRSRASAMPCASSTPRAASWRVRRSRISDKKRQCEQGDEPQHRQRPDETECAEQRDQEHDHRDEPPESRTGPRPRHTITSTRSRSVTSISQKTQTKSVRSSSRTELVAGTPHAGQRSRLRSSTRSPPAIVRPGASLTATIGCRIQREAPPLLQRGRFVRLVPATITYLDRERTGSPRP